MDAINMMARLKDKIRRIISRDDGSSIIELAIVFPILLILFVLGTIVYGGAILLLLGLPWLKSLLREVTVVAETEAPPVLEPADPTDDSAALPDSEPPPRI